MMHSRNAHEQGAINKRFGENLRRIREDCGLIQKAWLTSPESTAWRRACWSGQGASLE